MLRTCISKVFSRIMSCFDTETQHTGVSVMNNLQDLNLRTLRSTYFFQTTPDLLQYLQDRNISNGRFVFLDLAISSTPRQEIIFLSPP